ncbi:MAG: hypothetical protein PHQ04_03895 [Opitutaceae bacterium]|nr:hypothetical protein [Opitutaceae bacterium]
MPLRTLTLDFNSFFASVEQQERPELRGRPVAVVPVKAETTGCIAVSIEAKQLGLARNLRVAEARRLCPGVQVVESRPEVYIRYHRRLVEVIESCIHITEVQSIDEVMCELTAKFAAPERAVALARRLKETIAREVGPCLRSSIGLAPNWLLSKVASDMQKPDGLVVLDDADIPGKLLGLGLEDFCGIGSNMARRLRAAKIDTVAQLYAANKAQLRGIWGGIEGERMFGLLHGEMIPRPRTEAGTIGHGHVLPPELRHDEAALAVLHRLLQKAAMRLRHSGHFAGGLHLRVLYRDRAQWSDELRFNETQDTLQFTHALNQLWNRRPVELHRRAPLQVGVVLFHLLDLSGHTPDLFSAAQEQTRTRLLTAVDELNRTFGKNTVYFGGAHGATRHAPMRIAFTRIPEPELEEIDPRRQRRIRGNPPPPAAPSE